jgi:hypothetical protein
MALNAALLVAYATKFFDSDSRHIAKEFIKVSNKINTGMKVMMKSNLQGRILNSL